MKMNFEYYRVPGVLKVPNKGRPHIGDLFRYFRGDGFFNEVLALPLPNGGSTVCTITVNGKTYTAIFPVSVLRISVCCIIVIHDHFICIHIAFTR